jgi:hypothetical protein
MSDKRKILIQLDTDPLPSSFDRVVAVDAGVEELFSYGGIAPEHVKGLVHGAIFTRHPRDLKHTALFIGGSDVTAGEQVLAEARKHCIPPAKLQVSMMLDSNGANTTAAAAVWAAARQLDLANTASLVLAGTGPVGQRVAHLLARAGGQVRLASRHLERSATTVQRIVSAIPHAKLEPACTSDEAGLRKALAGCQAIFAAGAAGVCLLPKKLRTEFTDLKILLDMNAVPPVGIEGVDVFDNGKDRDGVICYGALGIGGTKMKLHKSALAKLFETNDLVLDIDEIYALATRLT